MSKPIDLPEDYPVGVHLCGTEGVCECVGPDRHTNWHGRVFEMGRNSFQRNIGKSQCKAKLILGCTKCNHRWESRGFKNKYWRELGIPTDGHESRYWKVGIAFGRIYGRCKTCPGAGVMFVGGEKVKCPDCIYGLVGFENQGGTEQ